MTTAGAIEIPEQCRPYHPRGAALDLFYAKDKEILIVGAAGTGKSRAVLEKVHLVLQKYAGARALICRKTRESMTQSTLVTYEAKVVQEGFFKDSVQRSHRQSYLYPNGSELVVGGLDKPSKILSTEFDVIFVDEATEIDEDFWETLLSRLRNHVVPYQQAIAGCNPDASTHWLNQRANKGTMRRLVSRHKDNPAVTQDYLDMLDRLTGVRRLRLRDGIWAAAEGRVFDDYDPAVHVIKLDVKREFFKEFFASVDWGYVHAGVIQVWGLDADRRMYLVHETYRSGKTVDWWIGQAKKVAAAFGFNLFVCDSAEPAYIEQFKRAGLNAVEAYKSVRVGIENMQERLRTQGDGKPRLFILDDCLAERDQKLVDAKKPWSTAQEFDSYVWADNGKEAPKKEDDDGMDCARYACSYADKLGGGHLVVGRAK